MAYRSARSDGMSGPRLPVVTLGGRTPRQRAIQQAQAWQREQAEANTPTPSATYLVVTDLLAVVLSGPDRQRFGKRGGTT